MEDISSVNMHTEHQFDSTNEKIYQLFERVLLRLMDFMNNTLNDSDRKMHMDFIDEHGLCMLDYLSALNYPRCLTILLQSGATVDIHKHTKRKFSVLHVAVKSAHFGVLKLLVEKGKADLFAMNEYAETPLDFAIRREYKDIVYYLREKMQDSLSFKAEQDEDQPNTERVQFLLLSSAPFLSFSHTLISNTFHTFYNRRTAKMMEIQIQRGNWREVCPGLSSIQ